jgi:hypothetical protein
MTMNFLTPNSGQTTSLDLPPVLAGLMSMAPATPPQTAMPMAPMQPQAGLSTGMTGGSSFMPQYQEGGEVMPPTSVGVNPEMQAGQPMSGQMLEMQLNQFASQHPQQVQQVKQAITEVLQTGELTPQELNMVVQLASVAAQNPEMYPYVRKFAIQQGIATEQDLPAQYDQGLVFILLLVGRAMQKQIGMGQGMESESEGEDEGDEYELEATIPTMKEGGAMKNPQSKPVLAMLHTGEYVIPEHIVRQKGTAFFDKMIGKDQESAAS